MTVLSVTLSRAHKIAERLKNKASELLQQSQTLAGPITVQGTVSGQTEKIKTQAQLAVQNAQDAFVFLNALAHVRSVIAQHNEARGINAKLSQVEALNRKIAHLKVLQAAGKDPSSLQAQDLESYKPLVAETSRYGATHLSVVVLSKDQLVWVEQQLTAAQKELFALTDQIAELNGTKVSLDLPEVCAQLVCG